MTRVILFAQLLILVSCVPWVIRPIDEQKKRFDAAEYVNSIWDTKVLPAAAVEISTALPPTKPILVKGEAKILRVDRTSRSGVALLDLAPFDGHPDVTLQIGPVLHGMALRDSLPFIRFTDFLNQLDFARVGNQLNARVEQSLLNWDPTPGATISFLGALTPSTPVPEITPLTLSLRPLRPPLRSLRETRTPQ